DVMRIINEPTAACLAYGMDRIATDDGAKKIMVFSFGGGTHDVTAMEINGNTFKVLATSGDTQTGGADIDDAIVEKIVNNFLAETGVNLRKNKAAMVRLKEAAEKAKIELSTKLSANIAIPFIAEVNGAPKHLDISITQAELEEIALPIVKKVENTIKMVLYDCHIGADEIDKLILIGGQTKMPLVRRVVEQYMGKIAEEGVDPMECVAIGAAYQGAVLTGELNYQLLDVTPLTLGVEDASGTVQKIIMRNTSIPAKRSQIFTTAEDNQTEVTIHVVQGERLMAADCASIGLFDLHGIPPRARGVPQIEVSFEIDANGILKVSAKERASGVEAKVTISGHVKVSEEDKKRMLEEAEMFAGIDRARKEEAELFKTADHLLYRAAKLRKELFLPKEQIAKIEKATSELKDVMQMQVEYSEYDKKLGMLKAKIVEIVDLINTTIDVYEMGEGA
ncbi:MAG TPA: Hsp70 family protein, partial [Nitrososphaerales archaeon]